MSALSVDPGACPATAGAAADKADPAKRMRARWSFMGSGRPFHLHLHRMRRRLRAAAGGFGRLRRRRRRGREHLAESEPHRGDLLLLLHDDFLRNAAQLLVMAIAKLG